MHRSQKPLNLFSHNLIDQLGESQHYTTKSAFTNFDEEDGLVRVFKTFKVASFERPLKLKQI